MSEFFMVHLFLKKYIYPILFFFLDSVMIFFFHSVYISFFIPSFLNFLESPTLEKKDILFYFFLFYFYLLLFYRFLTIALIFLFLYALFFCVKKYIVYTPMRYFLIKSFCYLVFMWEFCYFTNYIFYITILLLICFFYNNNNL